LASPEGIFTGKKKKSNGEKKEKIESIKIKLKEEKNKKRWEEIKK